MPSPEEGKIPTVLDRGDGQAGRIGTPTSAGQITWQGSGGNLTLPNMKWQEPSGYPIIERAEHATITHKVVGPFEGLRDRLTTMGRGLMLEPDEFGNLSRVLSAKLSNSQAGKAELEIVAEGQFDPPPDTFDIMPVELGINFLRWPRYFYALNGSNETERLQNQDVIRMLQNYFDNVSPDNRNLIPQVIYDSIGSPTGGADKIRGTDMAKYAALEIIQKYWRGEETPYVTGVQATWVAWYFNAQPVNLGGYVCNPATVDYQQLPPEFAYYYDGNSVKDLFQLIAQWNPQCYSTTGLPDGSPNISWLRKADHPVFERMLWRWERTWLGAPVGHWDEQYYGKIVNGKIVSPKRPQVVTDFMSFNPGDIPTS